MKLWAKQNTQASINKKAIQRKKLRALWDTEKVNDPKCGAAYEKKSRDHAVRQTGAKEEIVDTLNRNGRRSYTSLQKAIKSCCSYRTIERHLKSTEDDHTFSQNVRPLLSEGNRLKQVNFSKHVHNRWGLPTGTKILWTMRYRNPYLWTFAKPMSLPRSIVTIMNSYSSATKNGFTAWLRGHLPRLARVSASTSRHFHVSTSRIS